MTQIALSGIATFFDGPTVNLMNVKHGITNQKTKNMLSENLNFIIFHNKQAVSPKSVLNH